LNSLIQTLILFLDKIIDNSRYEVRRFPIEMDAIVHGFAGYFETVLYKDVMLSINPATHSPGMFSWFPVLFPLLTPVHVKKVNTNNFNIYKVSLNLSFDLLG